jgi:omega-hydroxy-beta-dihydromenaquinone-9 sulfotransferase
MPEPLYGGRALTDWILAGGRPERAPFAHTARLRWHATWFELNWRTAAARLESLPLPLDPVFIVGPWRSGTTALHELLAAATAWPTPQTWQCFNPSTCFLVKVAPRASSITRPMDAGIISSLSPQEDEFATLLLGEDSVYRGFIDPRRLRECGARLWSADATAVAASERWQNFIRGIAAGSGPQRLLLKSPNHTFRLAAMRRCFPRAQYIWMGRRSQEIVASNEKMWRAMMARYALWSCPTGMLEEFLREALRACAAALARALDEFTQAQLLWVDFDDFRTDPARVLHAVLDFLQVDTTAPAAREARIRRALQDVTVHAGSRVLAPADPFGQELDALMASARQRFGQLRNALSTGNVAGPGADPLGAA